MDSVWLIPIMLCEASRTSPTLPSMIDASKFCSEDLQMFLECSNYIENSRRMKRHSAIPSVSVQKTREELFDIDSRGETPEILIDENFNFNNLSLSMKNLFQYFNEEIEILSERESIGSVKDDSERDQHRPVIVDASPKVWRTVRYKSSCVKKVQLRKKSSKGKADSLVKNSKANMNSVEVVQSPRKRSYKIPQNINVEMSTEDKCHTAEENVNISVKERISFFNTLISTKKKDRKLSSSKKIDISLQNPVSAIKSKLYKSFSDRPSSVNSEEPILPAQSVRSQIEKFENGELISPFQSRSSSEDTLKMHSNSSLYKLSSPTLVNNVQKSFQHWGIVQKSPRSSDSQQSSDSDTLAATSPRPESSPSDYYSSSDDPFSRNQKCIPYYSPSPTILTPDSMNTEPNFKHPFVQSGENLKKLQVIVQKIRELRAQGFIDVSQDLFEQFLMMLCMSADICLLEGIESCQGDLDEIVQFLQVNIFHSLNVLVFASYAVENQE